MAETTHPSWASQFSAYQMQKDTHPAWWRQYSLLIAQTTGVSFWALENSSLQVGTLKKYLVQLDLPAGAVTSVDLLAMPDATSQTGGQVLATSSVSPFTLSWTPTASGAFFLAVRSTNDQGAVFLSATLPVRVPNSGATGTYAAQDYFLQDYNAAS